MNTEKIMLDYVGASSSSDDIILFVPLILIILLVLIGAVAGFPSEANAFIFLLALLTLALLIGGLTWICSNKEMLSFLKANNIYNEAVSDFTRAVPFLDDRIHLSSKYVFSRASCAILRYTDISRVYQYVHNVNFIERNRELHAVDNSGKIWVLCKLETHRAFQSRYNKILDAKLVDVLDFMLYKNPQIAIGYV